MDFKSSLAALELEESVIHKQELSTKSKTIVLSNPPAADSPFQPVFKETEDLTELRDWLNIGKTLSKDQPFYPDGEVIALVEQKVSLTKEQLKTLRFIFESYLVGKYRLTKKQLGILEYEYAPFKLAVYAVEKLSVYQDQPFVVSGEGPVFLAVGEVNIYNGGVVKIHTNSNIITDKMKKYNSAQ